MKGLRIIQAEIDGVLFPISQKEIENPEKNFYTVVIGNNAAGKSRLLVNILNGLRQVGNSRIKSKEARTSIDLLIDNKTYNISNEKFGMFEEYSEGINLISISNSLFDKFPHQAKSDKNYSYIGTRMTGIGTHKRGIVNDLMDIFSVNLTDNTFVKKAKELFDFLKIKPVIKISLRASFSSSQSRLDDLLKNTKSIENLKRYLIEIAQQGFYRQQSNVLDKYANDEEFLKGFYHYLKTHLSRFKKNSREEMQYHEIHLDNPSKNTTFINEYVYFSLLRRLNILTYDYIKLQKGKVEYDIQESSTGEIGLLITFLRAIPEMKSNSIIFIDEPEISLHPSWQMRYIELLRSFLKGYTGCHILIATHSHFLLSDLKEGWSSVLVLNNTDGKINAELKKHTPFGWSPEAILYEVFGVVNVRNHYFEYDLRQMLSLISNRSIKINQIEKYIKKFKQFQYSEGDPLNLIIKEAEAYVKEKK